MAKDNTHYVDGQIRNLETSQTAMVDDRNQEIYRYLQPR